MVAVVLGGGVGTRFGAALPKQLLALDGRTLVEHCVSAFAAAPGVDEILLVMPPAYHEEVKAAGRRPGQRDHRGRRHSLGLGPRRPGAHRRPLSGRPRPASSSTTRPAPWSPSASSPTACEHSRTTTPIGTAVPTSDTILTVEDGVIAHVPPRETLYRAQTPQCFHLETIMKAHALAAADPAFQPTDDCGVVLRYLPATPVHVIPGSEDNIKITYPTDLAIAEALLRLASPPQSHSPTACDACD